MTLESPGEVGTGDGPSDVFVAHVNADAVPDLVTANHDSGDVRVLRGFFRP